MYPGFAVSTRPVLTQRCSEESSQQVSVKKFSSNPTRRSNEVLTSWSNLELPGQRQWMLELCSWLFLAGCGFEVWPSRVIVSRRRVAGGEFINIELPTYKVYAGASSLCLSTQTLHKSEIWQDALLSGDHSLTSFPAATAVEAQDKLHIPRNIFSSGIINGFRIICNIRGVTHFDPKARDDRSIQKCRIGVRPMSTATSPPPFISRKRCLFCLGTDGLAY